MPGSPALRHDRAGRVAPTSIGLRFAEATADAEQRVVDADWNAGTIDFEGVGVTISVEEADGALQLIPTVRVHRRVQLDAVRLGLLWSPAAPGGLRFLRHGWSSDSSARSAALDAAAGEVPEDAGGGLATPPDRRGWQVSDLVTVAGAAPSGPACLVGVIENGTAFGRLYLRREGVAVRIEVELQLDVLLAAGDELAPGTVRAALGTEIGALLECYAETFGRAASARVSRPFLAGSCFWRHDAAASNEAQVRRHLDAVLAHPGEIEVDALLIGEGHQSAIGDWLETDARFPRGLGPVALEIADAGLIPGLWTAPFRAAAESRLAGAHPDWLLQAGNGTGVLDLSRPEVLTHLEHTYRALAEQGFRYLELDALHAGALPGRAFDPGRSRAARLRGGLEAIRRGAGDEVFLLGRAAPLGVAVGVVDGMQVADVAGMADAVTSALSRSWMHRRLWQNDAGRLHARARDGGSESGGAAAAALAAATGGVEFLDEAALLGEDESAALARTGLLQARRVDRCGVPGALRARDLLAELPVGFTARAGDGVFHGWLNPTDAEVTRDVEPSGVEVRIGAAPEQAPGRRSLAARSGALLHAHGTPGLAVFCDFDGTFSVQDVGATLAQRYAADRRPAAWARYERGEVTPWQYNLEILDGLPVPLSALESFLRDEIQLDAGAGELVAWCETRAVPFRILSDGFDWNLGRLQALSRVRFAYEANRLHYQGGRWRIRAGAPNPACGCGTGVCKAGILQRFRVRHPGTPLVHIGNGRVSDTCGAIEADHAFAKDSLALELDRRGHPYEPFDTLLDIIPTLDRLLK